MPERSGPAPDGRPAPAPDTAPAVVQRPGEPDLTRLWPRLQAQAATLGFSQITVADVDLHQAEPGLLAWLAAGFHGQMQYMAAHGLKRARPAELVPGTVRVLSVRMDYLPPEPAADSADAAHAGDATGATDAAKHGAEDRDTARRPPSPPDWQAVSWQRLAQPQAAVLSHYARGRDYHKVLRQRLQRLADWLAGEVGPFGHRVFTDSAPVLEVELAARSGQGWRGKHTLLLNREGGSLFFLGELFVDLPLPLTPPATDHCGACTACLDACPTGAIVAPYRLDARRCISYLTIELDGPIPPEWRTAIGNRIYGCDDCQLACPWNKYARRSPLPDFAARTPWPEAQLLALWQWDEARFLRETEGSAIRRIGHQRWRRNLAVALGNAWRATGDPAVAQALRSALPQADALVAEHITWALAQRA